MPAPPPCPRCCPAPGYRHPATHLGPLYLKTLAGRTLTLEHCHSIDTGYDLRLRVALAEGMPVEDQRLIFAGERPGQQLCQCIADISGRGSSCVSASLTSAAGAAAVSVHR
jgi:hypothetical protein